MNKVVLRRLGVMSIGKIYAVLTFFMSLLIAIPYGLIFMVFGASLAGTEGGGAFAAGGIVGGLAIMFLLPIVYAAIGFVGGIIVAAIYNVVAGFVGGIEMELEMVAAPAQYAAPPQGQAYY